MSIRRCSRRSSRSRGLRHERPKQAGNRARGRGQTPFACGRRESETMGERGLTPLPPLPTVCNLAVRVSLMYAAVFTIAGAHLPYLPVWLDWVGLGPPEIATVVALPMAVRI